MGRAILVSRSIKVPLNSLTIRLEPEVVFIVSKTTPGSRTTQP